MIFQHRCHKSICTKNPALQSCHYHLKHKKAPDIEYYWTQEMVWRIGRGLGRGLGRGAYISPLRPEPGGITDA